MHTVVSKAFHTGIEELTALGMHIYSFPLHSSRKFHFKQHAIVILPPFVTLEFFSTHLCDTKASWGSDEVTVAHGTLVVPVRVAREGLRRCHLTVM